MSNDKYKLPECSSMVNEMVDQILTMEDEEIIKTNEFMKKFAAEKA